MLSRVAVEIKKDKELFVHNVRDKREHAIDCVGIEIVDLETKLSVTCVVTAKNLLDAIFSIMRNNNWMYHENGVADEVIVGLAKAKGKPIRKENM